MREVRGREVAAGWGEQEGRREGGALHCARGSTLSTATDDYYIIHRGRGTNYGPLMEVLGNTGSLVVTNKLGGKVEA